jgi:hypothetical protein
LSIQDNSTQELDSYATQQQEFLAASSGHEDLGSFQVDLAESAKKIVEVELQLIPAGKELLDLKEKEKEAKEALDAARCASPWHLPGCVCVCVCVRVRVRVRVRVCARFYFIYLFTGTRTVFFFLLLYFCIRHLDDRSHHC